MALVDYGLSSASSSESEEVVSSPKDLSNLKRSRLSLPTATTLLGSKQSKLEDQDNNEPENNPALHGGRIRNFKHERGNWATYVYVPALTCAEQLADFQTEAMALLAPLQFDMQANDPPLHLSLSRTIVLHHHQIEEFSRSLKQAMNSSSSFSACLQDLSIYTNEERTRTFIAMELDAAYKEKFCSILQPIDRVMVDYRLPLFYDPPSFHVSLLWCVGDRETFLREMLEELKHLLEEEDTFHLKVNEVFCKCGNKEFVYKLK